MGQRIYFISSAVLMLLLHFLPEERGQPVTEAVQTANAVCTKEVLSQQLHLYLLQLWKTKIFAFLED